MQFWFQDGARRPQSFIGSSVSQEEGGIIKKVILLHGIWTSGWILYLLRYRLKRAGLDPVIFSYPSISRPFHDNVRDLARFVRDTGVKKVSFIGHSYGGLLVCGLLRTMTEGSMDLDLSIERCIFMGTPLQGSSLARRLSGSFIVRMLTGKSLSALKTGCSIPAGSVYAVMVAGTMNLGLGMFFMNGPGDGMVALEDTKAPWLDRFFVVKTSHLGLLLSEKVSRICVKCLL